MGDVQAWLLPKFLSPPLNPHPSAIATDSWREAERSAREILRRIQPTGRSEERRRAVVDYVQRLVRDNLGSEVFPFGSVPLKTYLPDGDIDLTSIGYPNSDADFATELCSILKSEEWNKDAEFEVKDVHIINAEVKLVKCLVQSIVLDISFNQIGGLCTLCFLEQVDRYIGKDHLLKRSIILIKAWCYYESRILGAHHGLISTYALEILVLYIFHLFHSSFNGPLAVLYRFLDYFSKFNWENYCISIHGPVPISSLPELAAETPENDGDDVLLSEEFISSSAEMFSVPLRVSENTSPVFLLKHLNIIDPLKENNNLGRSVSKGNFFRIRSAFSYGARKLGGILSSPREQIPEKLNVFFQNTLERHGSGERPDIQDSYISSGSGSSVLDQNRPGSISDGKAERQQDSLSLTPSNTVSHEVKLDKYSKMEFHDLIEGNLFSTKCSVDDVRDCASGLRSDAKSYKALASSSGVNSSRTGNAHAFHHVYHPEVGAIKPSIQNDESYWGYTDAWSSWTSCQSENAHLKDCSEDGINGDLAPLNLSDLTGDYDLHFRSLLYAQYNLEVAGLIAPPTLQSYHSQFYNGQSRFALHRQSMFVHLGANGVGPKMPFSPGSFTPTPPYVSSSQSSEDTLRQRGTGTYLPNMNYRSYMERLSPWASNPEPLTQFPRARDNDQVENSTTNSNSVEKIKSHKPSNPILVAQVPVSGGNDKEKTAMLDIPQPSFPSWSGVLQANGSLIRCDSNFQSGSFAAVASGAFSPDSSRRLGLNGSCSQGSTPSVNASNVQRPEMTSKPERLYQLKDDLDFPPLSA